MITSWTATPEQIDRWTKAKNLLKQWNLFLKDLAGDTFPEFKDICSDEAAIFIFNHFGHLVIEHAQVKATYDSMMIDYPNTKKANHASCLNYYENFLASWSIRAENNKKNKRKI